MSEEMIIDKPTTSQCLPKKNFLRRSRIEPISETSIQSYEKEGVLHKLFIRFLEFIDPFIGDAKDIPVFWVYEKINP